MNLRFKLTPVDLQAASWLRVRERKRLPRILSRDFSLCLPKRAFRDAAALTLLVQGCASLAARGSFMSDRAGQDPHGEFPTPVYPGAVTDLGGAGGALSSLVSWM